MWRLTIGPWLSAMMIWLKPFLCSSSATVRVIFVAVFLASSYNVPFRPKCPGMTM